MEVEYRNPTTEEAYHILLDEFEFCDALQHKYRAKCHIDMFGSDFANMVEGDFDWADIDLFDSCQNEWFDSWTKESTLREICTDLATRIRVPVLSPVTILGRPCETAGAFLTLKQMLANAGADVTDVAPSTPIREYLYKYPDVIKRFVRSKPGAFPRIQYRVEWLFFVILASFLAILIPLGYSILTSCITSFILAITSSIIISTLLRMPGIRFQNVITFRDLIRPAFPKAS